MSDEDARDWGPYICQCNPPYAPGWRCFKCRSDDMYREIERDLGIDRERVDRLLTCAPPDTLGEE